MSTSENCLKSYLKQVSQYGELLQAQPHPCEQPVKSTLLHFCKPCYQSIAAMTTSSIPHVTLTTAANVYFDGKCVSHSFTLADGTKKSVGVVLPSQLTFGTGAAEIMECVAGSCEYKLPGSDAWLTSKAGEQFHVPANSKFDIKVAEAYHYICHYA